MMESRELEEARKETEEKLIEKNKPLRESLLAQLDQVPSQSIAEGLQLFADIQKNWDALGPVFEEEKMLFLQYEKKVAELEESLSKVEEKQDEIKTDRKQILQKLEDISKEEVFQSKEAYEECLRLWLYLDSMESAEAEDLKRFERLVERIQVKLKRKDHDEKLTKMEKLISELKDLQKNKDLKPAEKSRDFKKIKDQFKVIHLHVGQNVQKLREQFRELSGIINQELGWEMWSGSKRKEDLVVKAEALLTHDKENELGDKLKEIQAEWKSIGFTHKGDDAHWEKFKELCSKVYEKFQEQQKKNEGEKETLIKKAEELQKQESWNKTAEAYKELQKEWSEVGPIHPKINSKLNRKFSKICKEFFEKRREHFKVFKEEQKENLKLKEVLLARAEKTVKDPNWKAALPTIKKIQEEWKKIGPVPKAKSDEVWKKFQETCNQVYDKKREEDEKHNVEYEENLKQKEELLKQMEEALGGNDLNQISSALDGLGKKWKDIGFVPAKKKKGLEMQYRKVWSDFKKKEDEVKNEKNKQQLGNSEKKSSICQSLEEIALSGQWSTDDEKIAVQTKEWEQTGLSSLEKMIKKRYREVSEIMKKAPDAGVVKKLQQREKDQLNQYLMLCMKMERLAGIESKNVSAEVQRMWMVAELQEKMGKKNFKNKKEEINQLRDEKLLISWIKSENRSDLDERFKVALEKALQEK